MSKIFVDNATIVQKIKDYYNRGILTHEGNVDRQPYDVRFHPFNPEDNTEYFDRGLYPVGRYFRHVIFKTSRGEDHKWEEYEIVFKKVNEKKAMLIVVEYKWNKFYTESTAHRLTAVPSFILYELTRKGLVGDGLPSYPSEVRRSRPTKQARRYIPTWINHPIILAEREAREAKLQAILQAQAY